MENRTIASLTVTVNGVGCNNFGRRTNAAATSEVVDAALNAGVNFFDTANMYGDGLSEEYLGRALAGRRSRVVIATKFGMALPGQPKGASPALLRAAVKDSLRRLRTDYIDLYQLHEPDPDVPIAETLGALRDLVAAGDVREIGCSNFSGAMLRDAAVVVAPDGAKFVSVQNELSLLRQDDARDALREADRLGMAYLPYYPLASGLLTGKYRLDRPLPEGTRLREPRAHYVRFLDRANLQVVERLIDFADARGRTLLELAFAWLLAQQAIPSVIAGARTPEQARSNASAAMAWRLTAADLEELATLTAR